MIVTRLATPLAFSAGIALTLTLALALDDDPAGVEVTAPTPAATWIGIPEGEEPSEVPTDPALEPTSGPSPSSSPTDIALEPGEDPTPAAVKVKAPAVEAVIQEDDPRFDCRIHGNRVCGVEVQGTWYVLDFEANTFELRD